MEKHKLVYHTTSLEDLQKLIDEDVNNTTKITVTTECYKCGKDFTREEYLHMPPNILILLSCQACDSTFSESIQICGPSP